VARLEGSSSKSLRIQRQSCSACLKKGSPIRKILYKHRILIEWINMGKTHQHPSQRPGQIASVRLTRGIGWGLVGGLSGTLVMDLILIGALTAAGLPALTCFSIVGNTVGRFLSILGIEMAGGVPLGVAAHYLIGPVVGAIYGAAAAQVNAFRLDTLKKGTVFGILYVEILSQPILATTPILLKMTAAETLKWFGGSFAMHLIFGVVLGIVVSNGLRLAVAENHRS
jgi:hypothetical protein